MRRSLVIGLVLTCLLAGVAFALFLHVRDLSSSGALVPNPPIRGGEDARGEKIVGVVSRLAPSTLYEGYQPVLDYLSRVTPYRYQLRARGYRETVEDLVAGRTQAAFIGSLLYVEAHAAHGVVPVVCPRNARGEPTFESLVVVRVDSPARALEDLAGRIVGVPPADSLSANWLRLTASDGVAFTTRFFAHHEAVVRQVLRGTCDAGVVKDRAAAGHLERELRVIARSGPMPGSPLVVARDTDPKFSGALAAALLALDPMRQEDKTLLAGWDPEFAWGFAAARDEDYDVVRALGRPRGGAR